MCGSHWRPPTPSLPWRNLKAKARNWGLGWDTNFPPTEVSKNVFFQGKGMEETQHSYFNGVFLRDI